MTITVWILGDQLSPNHPALKQAEKAVSQESIRVLMIESKACLQHLPYHPKKLVLILSAIRHYAEEMRLKGYQVEIFQAHGMLDGLKTHIEKHHPAKIVTMAASSYQGRKFQQSLSTKLGVPVEVTPNSLFLTSQFDPLPDTQLGDQVRQETFYRVMRRHFNLLMDDHAKPLGGKWNFDSDNRKPLPKKQIIPKNILFNPDPLTKIVIHELQNHSPKFGQLAGFDLAVTQQQVLQAVQDFFGNRLVYFGTYEDALSSEHPLIFHALLSPYLNLGQLNPLHLARKAEQAYKEGAVTINNAEGFIRQVIGWREYMHWQYRRLMPKLAEQNFLNAKQDLPDFFWTGETDLSCLSHILCQVKKDGYAHHIERLMVLSNFCLLVGIQPQQVLEWFQSSFIDAYDWVMVPNVIGMGLYADGGQIGTKPYIASANYINRMGDFCKDCRYDHRKRTGEDACPFNFLYWGFLMRQENQLQKNMRMARMLYGLKNFDREEQQKIKQNVNKFINTI